MGRFSSADSLEDACADFEVASFSSSDILGLSSLAPVAVLSSRPRNTAASPRSATVLMMALNADKTIGVGDPGTEGFVIRMTPDWQFSTRPPTAVSYTNMGEWKGNKMCTWISKD